MYRFQHFRSCAKQFPDLRILSFGSQQPNNKLALPKGAEFFFCPPQDQIRDLYSQCDVWITASRSEGFNLPAMEAMACRTPVVSTRTGWPEEAVKTGINGVLVDVDDQIGLAKGVQWVLSQSDEDWRKPFVECLRDGGIKFLAGKRRNVRKSIEEGLSQVGARRDCREVRLPI